MPNSVSDKVCACWLGFRSARGQLKLCYKDKTGKLYSCNDLRTLGKINVYMPCHTFEVMLI